MTSRILLLVALTMTFVAIAVRSQRANCTAFSGLAEEAVMTRRTIALMLLAGIPMATICQKADRDNKGELAPPRVQNAYSKVPPHGTLFKGKLYGYFGKPDEKTTYSLTSEHDIFAIPLAKYDRKHWERFFLSGGGGASLHHYLAYD